MPAASAREFLASPAETIRHRPDLRAAERRLAELFPKISLSAFVDLSDVYMTFFLPTEAAGKVAIGSDIRLVFDALPNYVIPAKASFVASVAQFTPKTVETESERLKLMFRVRARIDPGLLKQYIRQVKTGVPGMAYVKIDQAAAWPANLDIKLPQ